MQARRVAELADSGLFDQKMFVKPAVWIVFLLLVAMLIVGTLQISLLTAPWLNLHLPVELPVGLMAASVVITAIIVASDGEIIPEPFTTPATVTGLRSMVVCKVSSPTRGDATGHGMPQ